MSVKRIKDLSVHEVSLVDKAANKRKFLLTKSEERTTMDELEVSIDMAELIKACATKAKKAIEIEVGDDMGEDKDEEKSKMAMKKAFAIAAAEEAGITIEVPPTHIEKSEDQLPEAIMKEMSDLKKALEDQKAELAKMHEENLEKAWIEKADGNKELGILLKSIGNDSTADKVLGMIKAADKRAEEAGLFKSIGESGGQEVDEFEKAVELEKSLNPKLTKEQALTEVFRKNPSFMDKYNQKKG